MAYQYGAGYGQDRGDLLSNSLLGLADRKQPTPASKHYHPYGNSANCLVCNKGKPPPPPPQMDYNALLEDDDGMSVGFTELMGEIAKYETGDKRPNPRTAVEVPGTTFLSIFRP